MKSQLFIKVYILIPLIAVLLQACDLDLQSSFDFDEDARMEVPDPYNATIYEYITQAGEFDQNTEFDLMVEAVERAEMESVFNGGAEDKTVLLLRNNAMEEFLDDHGYDNVGEVPVATLQTLLNYHVITTRLKQRDMNIGVWLPFQTLIDGDDGLINLLVHNEWWQIHINNGAPDDPPTAKGAVVFLHNFEFTNGVAHQLNNYVRRVPFE